MITDSFYQNEQPTECVTLVMAKKHLRVSASNTSEDDLIQSYIDAATADRQNYIGRSVDAREFILESSQFENISFMANDANDNVVKIEYYAPGQTTLTELDPLNYKLRTGDIVGTKTIKFINPPLSENQNNAVIVTIGQGWETDKVPTPFKQAILLLVGDMYERREDRGEIGTNRAADSLTRAYRKY